MNINEISKPSVERAVVDKLLNRQGADPVAKSKKIADSIHFSDESKKRLKKHPHEGQEEQESDQTSPESTGFIADSTANFEAEIPNASKRVNRFGEPKGLTIDIKV